MSKDEIIKIIMDQREWQSHSCGNGSVYGYFYNDSEKIYNALLSAGVIASSEAKELIGYFYMHEKDNGCTAFWSTDPRNMQKEDIGYTPRNVRRVSVFKEPDAQTPSEPQKPTNSTEIPNSSTGKDSLHVQEEPMTHNDVIDEAAKRALLVYTRPQAFKNIPGIIENENPSPTKEPVDETIWVCKSCHYEFEGKITGKHWPYPNKDPETGYSCTGTVRQYIPLSALHEANKKIEELKEWLSSPEKHATYWYGKQYEGREKDLKEGYEACVKDILDKIKELEALNAAEGK
jgi:hypothetical protein